MSADMEVFVPNPQLSRIITEYLIHQPEQGEWPWEDHCEGLAGGILHALTEAGWGFVEPPLHLRRQ